MRRLCYIVAICSLFAACEHKDLCLRHPHGVTLRVAFDWQDAPEADPEGMCVYFYPEEGGSGQRFDFSNTQGGEIELRVGRYKVLCYNNDTEIVNFHNTDDYDTHGVTTREGNVLEPIYGNTANYAPRSAGSEEERVVISPDMMWGCTATEVEITDTGIRYICTPFGEEEEMAVERDTQLITLFPHELVCTYTYEVRNVKNLKHATQISGAITGMSGMLTFAPEELDMESVTVPFGGTSDGVSKVTGMFYTFGHHENNPDPHCMSFYVVMDDGQKYCFKDSENLNVTQQVHEAPDRLHVHIIIDGLDLPQPIENGHGFDPSVDDWQVVEEEIIL